MGERKVLVRYIPPDFDPSIIPKMKRDYSKLVEVRTMLPFSMRCDKCAEYMYLGKKFNSKKESTEEFYMGIRKYRFYIKCSVCSNEIVFKTDPKNSDYELESGAKRNFEVWRDTDVAKEEAEKEREEEEKMDSMKSLENRTIDSKIEMDQLDALDEIKAINQRHERVDTNSLLLQQEQKYLGRDRKTAAEAEAEADEIVKGIKFKSKQLKTLSDSDEEDKEKSGLSESNSLFSLVKKQLNSKQGAADVAAPFGSAAPATSNLTESNASAFQKPVIIIKKRKIEEKNLVDDIKKSDLKGNLTPAENNIDKSSNLPSAGNALGGLLGGYGSDNSDN